MSEVIGDMISGGCEGDDERTAALHFLTTHIIHRIENREKEVRH
jgi:hypothetical protein